MKRARDEIEGSFFLSWATVGGRGVSFRAKRSIRNRIRRHYVVSKKREQAGGVGCSGAKVGNAAKVDEDDDEEDEWTEDDDEETDESRST